jgi:hypothetical protein
MVEEPSDLQEVNGGRENGRGDDTSGKGLRSKVSWGVGAIVQILQSRPNAKSEHDSQRGRLFR